MDQQWRTRWSDGELFTENPKNKVVNKVLTLVSVVALPLSARGLTESRYCKVE